MRFIIISMMLASASASSQSFETCYDSLQKKIESLKAKGEKVSDDSRKEIDSLMAQMNHEHTELKRELEKKNQEINEKAHQTVEAEKNWHKRMASAYHDISDGFSRAWEALTKN